MGDNGITPIENDGVYTQKGRNALKNFEIFLIKRKKITRVSCLHYVIIA